MNKISSLKELGKIVIKSIIKLHSFSPILSITNDKYFGTNEELYIKNFRVVNGLRLSFFNIHLGKNKIYILTYLFDNLEPKKFNFVKFLDLDNMFFSNNYDSVIDEKAIEYQNHFISLDEEQRKIELEFIKYKLNTERERIDGAKSKINLYTSILLVIIPIILVFYKPTTGNTPFQLLLKILLFLSTLNMTFYIYNNIYVKPLVMSNFKDLKTAEADAKVAQNVNNYYFDWQVLIKKADLDVSYISNIQRCIVGIVLLSVIFYISSIIPMYSKIKENSGNLVYSINIDNLESKYSEDVEKISKIHTALIQNHSKELLIIYGQLVNDDEFNKLCNQFDIYKDIEVCKIVDKDIEKNDEVKIIIKGD
jgi:hypothetical protein